MSASPALGRFIPQNPIEAFPVLKSAGGKTQLLPQILPLFPDPIRGLYFEPFVGGGATFFALVRAGKIRQAVLGDNNPDLIAAYKAIKTDVEALIDLLKRAENTKEYFLSCRALDPTGWCNARRGARFLYLNKTAFNGLWRVNKSGQHNVPWAGYKNPTLCDEEGLRAASRALRAHAIIVAGDFSETVPSAKAGDVIYADPPYFVAGKNADFQGYTKEGFKDDVQARLEGELVKAARRGAHVVLSNADVVAARTLYDPARWDVRGVTATRSVNCKPDGRGPVGEILAIARKGPR